MITKITDKETENMWVMTSFGILMPSIRPPHTVPEGDNRTIQVRTRREQDLDILRDEYMGDELGPTIATPTFDYNFRAYCTPEAWGRALFDMALEIDYEKFKPTTDRYDDHELHGVYNSIWGTVCRLNAPWGGKGWSNEPITTHTEPLGTSGYTVVAGPPKKTEPKGYVWDVKPKGEKPEAIAEVEFSDGEQSEEATVLTQEDDELVVEILRMSEEDWDYLLTDEEKQQVLAKLQTVSKTA